MNGNNNIDGDKEDEKFKKNFEQFKKFFISENLFFSFCKYGNNILNHHIDSSNNYIYNEKYISLFQQTNTIEFITPLIKFKLRTNSSASTPSIFSTKRP